MTRRLERKRSADHLPRAPARREVGKGWAPLGVPGSRPESAGVCEGGVSAPEERVQADRQFQPRARTAPSPLGPRARLQQPRRGFPSPPPALAPPAPRTVSGAGSGRRRCRWWSTGDCPGAREGRKLEAAVQKSCEVSSAGGRGSWSGDEEDPRGLSPPGTNDRGHQGPDALGGRCPGRCGALGLVLCAFPCTVRLQMWKGSKGRQMKHEASVSLQ
ncbi:uncharacterized protein LOC108593251 isoform X2 [Callithrix jacchus]